MLSTCKVHSDGSHFISSYVLKRKAVKQRRKFDDRDECFDGLYFEHFKHGMSLNQLFARVYSPFAKRFGDNQESVDFVHAKIKDKYQNYLERRIRFERKAYLHNWTYFITVTYSDKLMTETEFYSRLKRGLSNFAFRRGWKYMGVFERGKNGGRLHFHALLFVPSGQMVGELKKKLDYSEREGRKILTHSNTFFEDTFGRNDFDSVDTALLSCGKAMSYLLKYVGKTGDKVFYARGISDTFSVDLDSDDFVLSFIDKMITKCVLFDDVFVASDDDVFFRFSFREYRSRSVAVDLPFAV
jgi:hypothetical protein